MWKIFEQKQAITKLGGEIEAIRKAQERLERVPKQLQLEWEDTLDRINRVVGRLNARIRTTQKAEDEETPKEEAQVPSRGDHDLLSSFRRKRGILSR